MQESVILVVEDDPTIRGVVSASLRRENLTVLSVSDAAEALRTLENQSKIDLLLTDLQLGGGMDGIELAHCIRCGAPSTKVLLMSGSPGAEQRALQHGCGFLAKPFGPADLLGRVRQLLLDAGNPLGRRPPPDTPLLRLRSSPAKQAIAKTDN